jgi:hypothetical protein
MTTKDPASGRKYQNQQSTTYPVDSITTALEPRRAR